MCKVIDIINIDSIVAHESWAGRWFWQEGVLNIKSEGELADPNSIPTFSLCGIIVKMSWDMSWSKSCSVIIDFDDPLILAMKLSEYELTNADLVIKKIKQAIRRFYDT